MKILKNNETNIVIYGTNHNKCKCEIINNTLYMGDIEIKNYSSFNCNLYELPLESLPTPFYSGYHYYTSENGWSFTEMYNDVNIKNKTNINRLINEYTDKLNNPDLTQEERNMYFEYIQLLESLDIQYTKPVIQWPIPPDYICSDVDYDPFSLNPNSICS